MAVRLHVLPSAVLIRELSSLCFAVPVQSLDYKDAFMVRDQLTEDERMVMDSARSYCDDKLMPRIVEVSVRLSVSVARYVSCCDNVPTSSCVLSSFACPPLAFRAHDYVLPGKRSSIYVCKSRALRSDATYDVGRCLSLVE